MNELPPKIESEKIPEPIPTSEETLAAFEQLVGEKDFEETRKLEDKEGLYLWEIKILNEDSSYTEYAYMRKGRHPEGQASESSIHVTFYDEADMPIGGHDVATYINESWSLHP